ncbi:HAD family hydrolase, partial [Bacillus sp. SRB_28]
IFDLDNTLIKGDSSTVWSRFLVREGWISDPDYLAREAMLMADYDRGEMNIADYVALIQAPLIGVPQAEVDGLVARCVREEILPRVYPQAWEVIRTLRARGEQMLVISASVSLLVQAVSDELGIDQALGIDVEMADGG